MIGLVLFCGLVFWLFGSIAARFVGAFTVAGAVGAMPFAPLAELPACLVGVASGIALWLAGHWFWAVKHRAWRTQLALAAFSRRGLHHLAPIPTNYRPQYRRHWGNAATSPPR
jgi:hypothetical protein